MKVDVGAHVGVCEKEVAHRGRLRLGKRIGTTGRILAAARAAPIAIQVDIVGISAGEDHVPIRIHDREQEPFDIVYQRSDIGVAAVVRQQVVRRVRDDGGGGLFVAVLSAVVHDRRFVVAWAGDTQGPERAPLDGEPQIDHFSEFRVGAGQILHELDVLVVRPQVVEKATSAAAAVELVDVLLEIRNDDLEAQVAGIH